ncbi:MAG TPA: chromate efflux transporter [Chthoniobacterales bacterium]|nr:chromate efflux transporter [Chthoniobacterales bacterium]
MRHPSFAEAFRFWLQLGFVSFGGPAGQIAIMQTELVEKRRWIGQSRFLHALNFCMLLPGPEAQQLAIYIGWLLHPTWGGIVAGALFVFPSMFILWGLSFVYVAYGKVPLIAAIFYGLKPAVIAIVTAAVIRIGRKALKNEVMWSIAALAFAAIFFFEVPFPLIVLSAGLAGLIGASVWPSKFASTSGHAPVPAGASVLGDEDVSAEHTAASWGRVVRILALGLGLWWAPLLLVGAWHGWDSTLFREGVFFSKAAVVTFGGAYAVLPYVAQQAVEQFGWLQTGQMMDGLGLAETTPGPLIMVLQFVGFIGAWNHPGALPPLLAATLGALITTWVTFVPCFVWIFVGAPYVERLRGNAALSAALSAVTAAVVGVILNLAVWFGRHVILPNAAGVDWTALVIAVLAFVGMVRWKWGVISVVIGGGLAGLLTQLAFQPQ